MHTTDEDVIQHRILPEETPTYSLLDKKHRRCRTCPSASIVNLMKLNIQKAQQQFRDAENELLRAMYADGGYDLENEFVREVLVCDILKEVQA